LLKIRLRRMGAKKHPSYRVVVAESTAPRDGTYVELLGHYNPLTNPTTFKVDEDKVRRWLARGAQPTDRVARLLRKSGVLPAEPPAAA
jgi:small subunit ribosomal protein S16